MPTPETLAEIAVRTQRSGNTTTAATAARTLGATLVVPDRREAERLRPTGVCAVSIRAGERAFAGTTGPYLLDISVLIPIAQDWSADRARADRLAGELETERSAHAATRRRLAEMTEARDALARELARLSEEK